MEGFWQTLGELQEDFGRIWEDFGRTSAGGRQDTHRLWQVPNILFEKPADPRCVQSNLEPWRRLEGGWEESWEILGAWEELGRKPGRILAGCLGGGWDAGWEAGWRADSRGDLVVCPGGWPCANVALTWRKARGPYLTSYQK